MKSSTCLGSRYRVIQARSPQSVISAGATFAACEAYCAEMLGRAGGPSRDSYIGTPIRVDGTVWGMLCFAGAQSQSRLFTSGDREMVRLMAQWIGSEIARRRAEEAVQASEERFRTAIASMSEG